MIPILIGLINQEDTPLGSFPELRAAAEASVEFINTELGGVGGRPLELTSCVVSFDVEQSQACAQEMVQQDVVALTGGIDVTSNGSIPVLEQNGIPQAGGIPANLVEQRSDTMFFFSGGTTGAVAAFLSDAADKGAETAVIAYGEFDAFEESAREYGVPVAESLGIDIELAAFPVTATDFLPILTRANENDPDAIVMLVAGSVVRAAHGDVRRAGHRGPALPGGRLRRRRDHRGGGRTRPTGSSSTPRGPSRTATSKVTCTTRSTTATPTVRPPGRAPSACAAR